METLAFLYQVIIASEPLLRECIAMLGDDGFEGELKAFYKQHLIDETDHAKWLKEDLGDYPINLNMTAATLAGTQYYLIRHVHPVCLMGYMLVLEGFPIDPAFIDKIEREHGAARTLRIHAEADPDHFRQLQAFPIPPEFKGMVEASRLQTLILIGSHGNLPT